MKLPFWPSYKGHRDINLGLSRVYKLLERVGNPHLKLPPTIHIAGTNGKGSTLAFLYKIFSESKIKIHTYTSPHLINFNERIVLAGKEISDELLNEILSECKKAAEKYPKIPVTFFEGVTVAAFLAFSRINADLLLLETGLGGRLDATNVLPKVLCSIITPISFDHEEFLGKNIKKISSEKAGIIKKNCPVIIGKQTAEALEVIEKQASAMNSKVVSYKSGVRNYEISLIGRHQMENAATAIACATSQQKFPITEIHIKSALKNTSWPARLQKIPNKKFELYLDGSHNLQGAETVKEFLASKHDYKKFIIFSMLKDKNCEGFLTRISNEIDELIALEIPNEPRTRKAEEILQIAKKIGLRSQIAKNFEDAFAKIIHKDRSLALICGSLYLAGQFLEEENRRNKPS